jgi:hypothetical protein
MALVFDHVESQLLNTFSRSYLVSLLSSANAAFDATYLKKHFYCKYKSLGHTGNRKMCLGLPLAVRTTTETTILVTGSHVIYDVVYIPNARRDDLLLENCKPNVYSGSYYLFFVFSPFVLIDHIDLLSDSMLPVLVVILPALLGTPLSNGLCILNPRQSSARRPPSTTTVTDHNHSYIFA